MSIAPLNSNTIIDFSGMRNYPSAFAPLNDDLVLSIAKRLPFIELMRFAEISKSCYFSTGNSTFWKNLCLDSKITNIRLPRSDFFDSYAKEDPHTLLTSAKFCMARMRIQKYVHNSTDKQTFSMLLDHSHSLPPDTLFLLDRGESQLKWKDLTDAHKVQVLHHLFTTNPERLHLHFILFLAVMQTQRL